MARRIVTKEQIAAWIAEGRGCGHGAAYRPWIQITTRGSPTGGNLQFKYVPELGRHSHLLSAQELSLARLLRYLGVEDLREQFPCWPWRHSHPLYEHPQFNPSPIPWSPGTIVCAERLKVTHPRYPGTTIIHIPTLDLLATLRAPGNFRAVAFAVKPDPDDVPLSEWDAIKLAIQKTYCENLAIYWRLITGKDIPDTLASNLEIIFHYSRSAPELRNAEFRFVKRLLTCLSPNSSISESLEFVKRTEDFSQVLSMELFHRALWFKLIPIDLRQAWVFSAPPTFTDNAWIENTKRYLFGDDI